MTAEIRPAVHADLPAVRETVEDAYRPWIQVIGMRPVPMDADYAGLIAAGRVFTTGSADGVIVLVPEDGVLLVENVVVRRALHGRGIGRRLLAFAEHRARSLSLPELRLYTHAKMTSNIALYESLGYHRSDPVGRTGGQVVHLRKAVSPGT